MYRYTYVQPAHGQLHVATRAHTSPGVYRTRRSLSPRPNPISNPRPLDPPQVLFVVALFGLARLYTHGLTAGGDRLPTAIPHSFAPHAHPAHRGGGAANRERKRSRLFEVQNPIRASQSLSALGPKAE